MIIKKKKRFSWGQANKFNIFQVRANKGKEGRKGWRMEERMNETCDQIKGIKNSPFFPVHIKINSSSRMLKTEVFLDCYWILKQRQSALMARPNKDGGLKIVEGCACMEIADMKMSITVGHTATELNQNRELVLWSALGDW